MIKLVCKNCGKSFNTNDKRRQYCSSDCWYKSRGIKINCETCGKEFLKSNWAYKRVKRHFCSKPCWNKAKRSKEHRQKIAEKRIKWFEDKVNRMNMSGENNPRWKGGSSVNYRKRYGTKEARLWIKAILERDGYKCLLCGDKDALLHVHHLVSWITDKANFFHPDNGITLCQECHTIIHINKNQFNPLPLHI